MTAIIAQFFNISSVWFFVFQSIVWFAICVGVIVSMDVVRPQRAYGNVKRNLGLLVLFLVLSSGLLYIMFGRSLA